MTRALTQRGCVDCRAEGLPLTRPASPPGPRCATHKRDRRQVVRDASWAIRILKNYALLAAEYWAIYARQGRHCAICERATGKVKRLAVDHDHATSLVRGLLCTSCNKMLGHGRDDPEFFRRAADYLEKPPAQDIIGLRIAPIDELKRQEAEDAKLQSGGAAAPPRRRRRRNA